MKWCPAFLAPDIGIISLDELPFQLFQLEVYKGSEYHFHRILITLKLLI